MQKKIKLTSIVLKKDNKEFIKSNILVLEPQQGFKSERHNVFTEEIIKIAFSLNDDKRMQAIDSIGTYAHGTSKDLVSEREEIKCNNQILINLTIINQILIKFIHMLKILMKENIKF